MKTILKFALASTLFLGLYTCKAQSTTVRTQTETVATEQPKSVNFRGEKLHYVEKMGTPLSLL